MRLFTNRRVKFTNKLVKVVFTKQVSKVTNLGFQCISVTLQYNKQEIMHFKAPFPDEDKSHIKNMSPRENA